MLVFDTTLAISDFQDTYDFISTLWLYCTSVLVSSLVNTL
nr:MAG TPA: hypothetical protein [Caudoviricetes sp.]